MIHYILFNLNKLKDDRPILITRAQVPSTPQSATKMPHYAMRACACANSKATCP